MFRATSVVAAVAVVGAVKMSSYGQGALFDKCISNADLMGKTLDDDITLVDRVSGCCPAGSVPGVQWQAAYHGAQVVCGFKADGTIAFTTSKSGDTATCEYNNCYVHKQNLPCADSSKQLLNGCCKATTKGSEGFPAKCANYFKNFNNVHSEKVNFCTTWHTDYGNPTRSGTKDKADDISGDKLIPIKIDAFTVCAGGLADSGGVGGAAGTGSTGSTGGTTGTTGTNNTEASDANVPGSSAWLLLLAALAGRY